jgi:ADP-ribosylglycohydrolase
VNTKQTQVLGGMVGLLVGDALGTPYETVKPENMPDLSKVDDLMVLPSGFKRQHAGVAPMTYSDDGSQALCLLASLLQVGFTQHDFGQRLLRWFDEGYLAARGGAFGTGGTTRAALDRIRKGMTPGDAGLTEETAMGNGGLMRALPMVFWHRNDAALTDAAMAQCRVTHAHPRAQATVAIFSVWARNLLYGELDVRQTAFAAADFVADWACDRNPRVALEAEDVLRSLRNEPGSHRATGGFHVVDTFLSAVAANEAGKSYTDVVRAAIQYGNDTDTTAAVAGGVAGLRFGLTDIPKHWRDACLAQAHEEVPELLEGLARHFR